MQLSPLGASATTIFCLYWLLHCVTIQYISAYFTLKPAHTTISAMVVSELSIFVFVFVFVFVFAFVFVYIVASKSELLINIV